MVQAATIQAIYVAGTAGAAMTAKPYAEAIAGSGLVGDRYANGEGHYSKIEGWCAQVTLIQSEAIEAVNSGHETDYTAAMLRRNLVTRGIQLKDLIGCEFECGEALLRGIKAFPPCMRLAHLIGRKDVLRYFSYCGGIGASVIRGGRIAQDDSIKICAS